MKLCALCLTLSCSFESFEQWKGSHMRKFTDLLLFSQLSHNFHMKTRALRSNRLSVLIIIVIFYWIILESIPDSQCFELSSVNFEIFQYVVTWIMQVSLWILVILIEKFQNYFEMWFSLQNGILLDKRVKNAHQVHRHRINVMNETKKMSS